MAARPAWKKTPAETAQALGDVSAFPAMYFALPPATQLLTPLPRPRDGDWLKSHPEPGQTIRTFERTAFRAQPHGTYRTIFVQPLGDFGNRGPDLELMVDYMKAFFFGLEVEMLPTVKLEDAKLVSRINAHTGRRQLLTDSILNWLSPHVKKNRERARRELVSICITMEDVYCGEEWNFVYGIARAMDGVGVWSFARMDPAFPDGNMDAAPTAREAKLILERSSKVITHEITHLFGLKHCVYFACLMNGANHEGELDAQRLHVCPVCLRKLHMAIGFEMVARETAVMEMLDRMGLDEAAARARLRVAEVSETTDVTE